MNSTSTGADCWKDGHGDGLSRVGALESLARDRRWHEVTAETLVQTGRDTEIAVELLCDHVTDALERIRPRLAASDALSRAVGAE